MRTGYASPCALAMVCLALAAAHPAAAHPLGNFTISHYSGLRLSPGRLGVDYGLDIAEIPTFQEMEELDADHDGTVSPEERAAYLNRMAESWRAGIVLKVDGAAAPLRLLGSELALLPGAGGLSTTRVWLRLGATLPRDGARHTLEYSDLNFDGRPGWKEIVATGERRMLTRCSLPSEDRSARLTSYPVDLINDPPQVLSAGFEFDAPPAAPAPRARISPAAISPRPGPSGAKPTASPARGDAFTRLIHARTLSPGLMGLSLWIAFALGAMHALSPGHGKTIVGAYLVGSRGTARQAVFLGLIVTAAHTVGVFGLGLLTLLASRYFLPDRIFPWLGFASGVMVAIIGSALFHDRIERLLGRTDEHRHLFWKHRAGADPLDGHLPVDGSGRVTSRSLLALGISGGIVPCPSALVVMLASIALHRIEFGLLLIVAFSLGLAVTLTSIGLLFVYAGQWLSRFGSGGIWLKLLPVGSAVVVTVLGMAIAVQSLASAGLLTPI